MLPLFPTKQLGKYFARIFVNFPNWLGHKGDGSFCAPEGAQERTVPKPAPSKLQRFLKEKRGVNKATPLLYTRMREELLNLGSNELIALTVNVDNFN